MKKIMIAGVVLFSGVVFAEYRPAGNESESIKEAIRDGYQVQRNLAYSYSTGRGIKNAKDFIQKNKVNACAWRKIILIANPNKIDASDPSNERFDCSNLDFTHDGEVWNIVHKYLPEIQALKTKGEYMVEKPQEPPQDNEIAIIDVDS